MELTEIQGDLQRLIETHGDSWRLTDIHRLTDSQRLRETHGDS